MIVGKKRLSFCMKKNNNSHLHAAAGVLDSFEFLDGCGNQMGEAYSRRARERIRDLLGAMTDPFC